MSLSATTKGAGNPLPLPAGIALTKPQRRILTSLGHGIARFAASCDLLRAREKSFPGLEPWFRAEELREKCALQGSGIFACPIILDGPRLALESPTLAADECGAALPGLSSPASAGAALLEIPQGLNLPLWLALLRLRPLRDFWERALRRSRMMKLLHLLPDAWLLDPAPLPPGAVIPRLEINAWSDLDLTSREFFPASKDEIADRLSAFPDAPGILQSSRPVSPDARLLCSFYRQDDGRVEWLGLAVRR